MSHPLISRNDDLRRLEEDGYEVAIRSGHMVVTSVPYVNARCEIKLGTLVSELSLAGDVTVKPQNHVIYWCGEYPCDQHGAPLEKLRHIDQNQALGEGLNVNFGFSNKPQAGYDDHHQKIETYVAKIAEAAVRLDPSATARTRQVIESDDPNSPFVYLETASARAGIGAVTRKLELSRVAIIGLGGTGSYVLDLVSKTPVKEIILFDGDEFLTHNAFRAPGAASIDELRAIFKKVDYLKAKYRQMHKGIIAHPVPLDATNLAQFPSCDFVFLCMDSGPAKAEIIRHLQTAGTPFIDVGLGVVLVDDMLTGIVRLTTSTADHTPPAGRIPLGNSGNNLYNVNIQVADLNALNAAMAVIRWKKLFGFYADLEGEHHATYTIDGNLLLNEDYEPEAKEDADGNALVAA